MRRISLSVLIVIAVLSLVAVAPPAARLAARAPDDHIALPAPPSDLAVAAANPSRRPVDPPSADSPDLQAVLRSYLEGVGVSVAPTQGQSMQQEPPVQASGLIGGNFPIANYPDAVSAAEELGSADICYNPDRNEYMAVWQGYMRATGNNIYARRLSSNGTFQGGVFPICQATDAQVAPSVAYDDVNHQFWVVWTDFRATQGGQVYARRVSPTGTLWGAEVMVNTSSNSAIMARAACGGGRCVVVWVELYGQTADTLARSYGATGSPVQGPMKLNATGTGATYPDVTYNGEDGHFLTVWNQWGGATGWDIVGWRLTSGLSSVGGRITISVAPAYQQQPRAAYSPVADRYLVAWQDGRNSPTWDVYGQRLSRSGTPVGSVLPIFAGAFHDLAPAVAAHSSQSQFMVGYERDISGAGQFQIYASSVSGAGTVSAAFVVRGWHNQRGSPAIAHATGSNNYCLAWQDGGSGTQNDIQAQRVNKDRALQGSLIVVSAGRKGQESPSVAYNSTRNEYFVAWQDYRSGSDYHTYGRRVSATGQLVGQELIIATAGQLNGNPSVAYNPQSDSYVVAWQRIHSQSTGYDIYAQRVGGAGSKVGDAVWISRDSGAVNEGSAHVVYNAALNEYLVVWHAFTDGLWNIWCQRLSASGQMLGTNRRLSTGSGDTQNARVAYSTQRNEYVVVWQDGRSGSRVDVYAQRLGGTAGPWGGNFGISTASGSKNKCDVAYSSHDNTYMVAWGDTRTGSNIYAQRLNATAGLAGGSFAVSAAVPSEMAPVIEYDHVNQEYVGAWWRFYDARDWDIYAGRVSAAGYPIGSVFGVATVGETQTQPELANNSSTGEFLIVWQDFRAGSYDIYAQRWQGAAAPTPTPTRTTPPPTRTPTRTVPAVTPTATRTIPPVTGPYHVMLPIMMKRYSSAAPTATPTSTTVPGGPLYFDDFGNPDSGWPRSENPQWLVNYLTNEYRLMMKVAGVIAISPGFYCADCAIETDLRNPAGSPGYYGVVHGNTDYSRYYALFINESGYYWLAKYSSGWHSLTGWIQSPFIFPGSATNHLRLEHQGSQIKAYINNNYVHTVTDSELAGLLRVGVIVGTSDPNCDVRFDNFAVYSLGGGGSRAGSR